ncbi:hypothetical protein JCM10449v2_007724 [Rhodotorula kratochvilovae]
MHRFADLPPELAAHIVRLSALPADPDNPLERLLLGPDPVRLYHAREYAPFAALAGGPGARGDGLPRLVNTLDLELWGEEQDDELARVLGACEGLEELVVTYIERAHLEDFAAGPNLAALSFRQCTLVSPYYPILSPPPDRPPPTPPSFASLTSLDLRLCSLRRDFLPLSTTHSPLPNLAHLLLHTGSHDQSPSAVRALVRAVAPQLRSLSLDCTAEALLFPPAEAGADAHAHALVLPQLRTLGLYWDAAYSRLAGASLLLPPSAASPTPPPPAYVHLALYPAALPALRAALLALLEGAGTRWRGVEHFRLEGTVRDLDRVEERRSDNDDDEEEDTETVRENPTSAILRAARKAGVDLLIEEAPTDDAEGIDGPQRATFTRGFGTSWWRFVREVEQERVQLART